MKIETYQISTKKGLENRKLYIVKCKSENCSNEIKYYGNYQLQNSSGYCKCCAPKIFLKKEAKLTCPNCGNLFHAKNSRINRTKNHICCSMNCKLEMIKKDKSFHSRAILDDTILFLNKKFIRIKMSAIRRGHNFSLTKEYFLNCYQQQKGLCYYTKVPLSFNKEDNLRLISVDRLDNTKGYIENNIVFCCLAVNTMKFNYTQEQVFEFINILKN